MTVPRAGEHAPPQCCASCRHHRRSDTVRWVRNARGYVVFSAVIVVFAAAFLWAAAAVLTAA